MIPCKDCLVFPMCLSFTKSETVLNNAVLYLAVKKCSILRDHIYHIAPDHPEGLDAEKYNDVVTYFYDFGI